MTDLKSLKAAAHRLAKAAAWFTSDEGIEEMLDKSYVSGSVHRSLIVEILHDGMERGETPPVRTVARALTVLSGEIGGDKHLLNAANALEPFVEEAYEDTSKEVERLLAEIIGNGDGTGRNPQLMIEAAVRLSEVLSQRDEG